MPYLSDSADFESEQTKWQSVIYENTSFPDQVFKDLKGPFLFFEFGLFFTNRFFECLKRFVKVTHEAAASFAVVDPDPVDYFYKEFKKYPVIRLSTDDSAQDYLRWLSEDPGYL